MKNYFRVVVTGIGMVTPLGNNTTTTWDNVLNGTTNIQSITQFPTTDFKTTICSSLLNFDPSIYLDPKEVRRNDLCIQYGVAASVQAMEDSGLELDRINLERAGCSIGCSMTGINTIEKNQTVLISKGPNKVSPTFLIGASGNMISGMVSIRYGLKGPTMCIATACATGAHSIGDAARMISYGDADIMLAGGSDMPITPLVIAAFSSMKALSTNNSNPAAASRPWDKDRDGFVMGEGAGVLVLEEYEHAKKRGAKIYAELIGFGMSSDAYQGTAPHPEGDGARRSMLNAIEDADLPPCAVDYINAHGTSTKLGDEIEALAIKRAFKDHAYKLAVSSTKSMTGHLLGAAGAVEAAFSILAIRDQVAPPTINLDNPDEGCDLNFVAHTAQPRKIEVSMSNSFGFGGTNGTLLFRRV